MRPTDKELAKLLRRIASVTPCAMHQCNMPECDTVRALAAADALDAGPDFASHRLHHAVEHVGTFAGCLACREAMAGDKPASAPRTR